MKKLIMFIGIAVLIAGCSDDDKDNTTDNSHLISPRMAMSIDNINGQQSSFTGILTVIPCDANSSIYYGNYVRGKLSPFYGYYQVKDGTFYDGSINREISLPIGTYNMIYWGTPKYQDPVYAHPAIKEAAHSIGLDMSKQSLGLFKISADTIYYPVFDLVYAAQTIKIGSESLKASLKRVVAGLKVVLKDKDDTVLSSSIDSVAVRITNIYSELNYYTGEPQGIPRTIAFPLARSIDGTQMSNRTGMLFPSAGKSEFQLTITLKNGNVKSFKQTLSSPLNANTKLTLTLSLGNIFSEESSGDFTVDNWNEKNENIDVPIIE